MRDWSFLLIANVAVVLLLITSCQTGQTSPALTGRDDDEGAVDSTPTISTSTPTPTILPAVEAEDPVHSAETEAGNADVLYVRAVETDSGIWTFHVTVDHPDTGWEDYADGWDVVTPDGSILKTDPEDPFTRLLLHPHENEQPFTRSQSRIQIPVGVTKVRVRAHDLVDNFGGREVLVDLIATEGTDYLVERAE